MPIQQLDQPTSPEWLKNDNMTEFPMVFLYPIFAPCITYMYRTFQRIHVGKYIIPMNP